MPPPPPLQKITFLKKIQNYKGSKPVVKIFEKSFKDPLTGIQLHYHISQIFFRKKGDNK